MKMDSSDMKKLDTSWRVCCRRLLGVSNRTNCCLIPHLMNTLPPSLQIFSRIVGFFKKSSNTDDSPYSKFFFDQCLINKESLMYKNLRYISGKLNCSIQELLNLSKQKLQKKLYELVPKTDRWQIDFIKEMIGIKEGFITVNFGNEMVQDILNCICTN